MSADDPSTLAAARLRRRARQYLDAGMTDAAQASLEALVERTPQDAHARLDLASVMLARGQLRSSTGQLLRALRDGPDDAGLLVQLVQRLYFGGEIPAARDGLARLERLPPTAPLLAELARLRWILGEIPAAKMLAERALASGMDSADTHYLYAMLCQYTGDIARAGEILADVLQRWPRFGDAAVALSNLAQQTPQSNHVDLFRRHLRQLPEHGGDPRESLVRAGFESALFKALDDLGEHADAWRALECSNALMRGLTPYDAAGEAAVTDALIHASTAIGDRITAADRAGFEGPVPIFVVGLPRSGTTLLDRMLSSHSQVASAGEINDMRRQLRWMTDVPASGIPGMLEVLRRSPGIDFAQLGRRYLVQSQWRARGRRFYVDKLPINLRMVPFIRRALPQAPILHMVREPMDVCFSNLKAMLGHASAYSYDMQSVAHYYRQHARLAAHWHATLPGAMLDVPYAALVSDTAATLRRVLAHCGLDWEDACLRPERNQAPVATPSASQVREAVHTRSLGEWQHYARQLQPLREALAGAQRRPG